MHRVAWALQTAKAIGQKYEKPWENKGFTASRTGIELLGVFPMFSGCSKGAENDSLDLSIVGNRLETSTAT